MPHRCQHLISKWPISRARLREPGGKITGPVTPFLAGDDWVQNLTIYVVNRTNRTSDFLEGPVHQPPDTKPLELGPERPLAIHLADYLQEIQSMVETQQPLYGGSYWTFDS